MATPLHTNSALLGTPALALQDAFSSRSRHRPQTERPRPANVVIRTPLPSPLFSLPSLNNFPPLSSSRKPAASASELHPAMGSLVAPREALKPLSYPPARRDESVVDDYHGVLIADPYRWLEDPESEEVKEFVERQARLTDSVLEKCEERERLRRKITALLDHPRYDTPFKRGGKYFYFHNTGLQAQSVLYVQLSDDGTVALTLSSVSKDGKYLAYGLSSSGSDWVTVKVMRIEDKQPELDTLSWVTAPRYKLVRVDFNEPESWTDVVPEDDKDVLETASAVNNNQLLVSYLSDVKYGLQLRDLETGVLLHQIPVDIGTVYGISGKREDSDVFIGFTSFLTPGIIYKCNLATGVPEMQIFQEAFVPGFHREDFEVKQSNPIVARIERKAGHGAGRPTQKMVPFLPYFTCRAY
ncbi:hypothetical protein BHE74_00002007 [Ensete ventricosum]|nr:hypothetical protein BHE74_00002007 [Ensete ventricosum]